MKKLLLLPIISALLSSCSYKYYETTWVVDFTKYAKEGFYIYPIGTEVKEKNYIPLSQIEVKFHSGTEGEWTKENLSKESYTLNYQGFVIPKGDYIISRIVEEAKKFDANGIIDFKVIETPQGRSASGMAVKIQ